MTSRLDEPTTAYPPRFRWLKRSIVVGACVVIGVFALWVYWRHAAHERLAGAIAAVRATGEPILPDDFDEQPVPDSENAAFYLLRAGAAIATPPEYGRLESSAWDAVFTDRQLALADAVVAANFKSLADARRARGLSHADWGTELRKPLASFLPFPSMSAERGLSTLLKIDAIDNHQHGNDAAAIEALRDNLHLANMIDAHTPSVIVHLSAMGIGATTTDAVLALQPELRLGPAKAAGERAASRAQAKALIDELLDESNYRAGLVRAMEGERADLALAPARMAALLGPEFPGFLRPMLELDTARCLDRTAALPRVVKESIYPKALALLPPAPASSKWSGLARAAQPVTYIYAFGPLNQFLLAHFIHLATRRVAAVALALRLYQVDHDGNGPATLDALVPAYLPAVPIDPFDPAGGKLRYLPGNPPAIYSVGQDGIDNGGDESKSSTSTIGGRWGRRDAVFRLSRPTTMPSADSDLDNSVSSPDDAADLTTMPAGSDKGDDH